MSSLPPTNNSSDAPESGRFNFIYKTLVPEPYDFIGLCAYSIYKQEKIKYIIDWRTKKGTEPSPEDLRDFNIQSTNRCDQYRALAVSRVEAFGEELIAEKIKILENSYKKEAKERNVAAWWSGVLQSLTASLILAILIGVIIIILIGTKFGFIEIIKMLISMVSMPPYQI